MTTGQERTVSSDSDQRYYSLEPIITLDHAESRVSDDEEGVENKLVNNGSTFTKKRPYGGVRSKDGVAKSARLGNGTTRTEHLWTEDTHRAFVSAVYHVGMKHASPAIILENMHTRPISITSERVKSHLQKYRLNRNKGKEEFMSGYDNWMTKAITLSNKSESSRNITAQPSFILDMMSSTLPVPGDIAAFLSYSVMMESKKGADSGKTKSKVESQNAEVDDDYVQYFTGASITFPQLSEEEKLSTLGKGLCYVMALFVNMSEHLGKVRGGNAINDGQSDCINGQLHQHIDSRSTEPRSLATQQELLSNSTTQTPCASPSIPLHNSNQPALPYYSQQRLHLSDLNSYEHRQSIRESVSHSSESDQLASKRDAVHMSNTQSLLASASMPSQSHHNASQYYSQPQHFQQTGDYHQCPSTFHQPSLAPAYEYAYERSTHPQHSDLRYPPPPQSRSPFVPYGNDQFNSTFESDHAATDVDLPLPEPRGDTPPWNVPDGVFNDQHRPHH